MTSPGKSHTLWIVTSALVSAVVIIWGLVLIAYRAEQVTTELALIRAGVTSLTGQLQSTGHTGNPQGNFGDNVELARVVGHALGRPDAPLTLVEFTDLECPFCRRFESETYGELKRRYIDTGKLRFVTKDFPLESHAHARSAAVASRCAGEQGQFWEFRNALIRQAPLSDAAITATAVELGLNVEQFSRCLLSPRHAAEVDRDVDDGRRLGVSGTPTFILGRTTSGRFQGIKIVGAQELSTFEKHMGAFATP